jgi:hypothetical protein
MGALLTLSASEFDALDMLVMQEGTPLCFEQLCAAWDTGHGACPTAASQGLAHLQRQVCEVGAGFMWIDYLPEKGYTFQTKWGNNWRSTHQPSAPAINTTKLNFAPLQRLGWLACYLLAPPKVAVM